MYCIIVLDGNKDSNLLWNYLLVVVINAQRSRHLLSLFPPIHLYYILLRLERLGVRIWTDNAEKTFRRHFWRIRFLLFLRNIWGLNFSKRFGGNVESAVVASQWRHHWPVEASDHNLWKSGFSSSFIWKTMYTIWKISKSYTEDI